MEGTGRACFTVEYAVFPIMKMTQEEEKHMLAPGCRYSHQGLLDHVFF